MRTAEINTRSQNLKEQSKTSLKNVKNSRRYKYFFKLQDDFKNKCLGDVQENTNIWLNEMTKIIQDLTDQIQ